MSTVHGKAEEAGHDEETHQVSKPSQMTQHVHFLMHNFLDRTLNQFIPFCQLSAALPCASNCVNKNG